MIEEGMLEKDKRQMHLHVQYLKLHPDSPGFNTDYEIAKVSTVL